MTTNYKIKTSRSGRWPNKLAHVCTTHCTLHTAHCTLHTTHSTLNSEHYTLHTQLLTLNATWWQLYTAHYISIYIFSIFLCNSYKQNTQGTHNFTLHNAHFIMNTAHHTLNTTYFTLQTDYWKLNTALQNSQCKNAQYTLHIATCQILMYFKLFIITSVSCWQIPHIMPKK